MPVKTNASVLLLKRTQSVTLPIYLILENWTEQSWGRCATGHWLITWEVYFFLGLTSLLYRLVVGVCVWGGGGWWCQLSYFPFSTFLHRGRQCDHFLITTPAHKVRFLFRLEEKTKSTSECTTLVWFLALNLTSLKRNVLFACPTPPSSWDGPLPSSFRDLLLPFYRNWLAGRRREGCQSQIPDSWPQRWCRASVWPTVEPHPPASETEWGTDKSWAHQLRLNPVKQGKGRETFPLLCSAELNNVSQDFWWPCLVGATRRMEEFAALPEKWVFAVSVQPSWQEREYRHLNYNLIKLLLFLLFDTYLLSAYTVTGTLLGPGDTIMKKTNNQKWLVTYRAIPIPGK